MSSAVVIGAGPAGLCAALELSKHGVETAVLEADRQVGGLSRTVDYRGYRFDIGGHRFFSKVPVVNELWREILGEDLLERSRLSRIYYRDHFFDYPLKPINALMGLGPVEAFLVTTSYTMSRLRPSAEEATFEQWVTNRFGRRLFEIFFKTYTEKVWGVPCSEISADWAAQRIKNLSLQEALRNSLLGASTSREGKVITSLIESFHYPRLGPGMMWERCEELCTARGARTLHGARVETVRHRRGRVETVRARLATGETVELGADAVISSMPLPALLQALDPAPPDSVLRAAHALRHRDYLTVVLIVKREEVFPDNWIYIHAPEVKVGRIQNYKNWSAEMVPDPSRTSLGLEYFLSADDEMWRWSDDRLIEFGIRECAAIGVVRPEEIEDGAVVRMRHAYPVYDHAYRENVALARRYLEGIANLQTIGRNGLHRYNNQDHSMLTGIFAARNVLGEAHDVWSVNTELEYGEEVRRDRATAGDRMVPRAARAEGAAPQPQGEAHATPVFGELDCLALGVAVAAVSALLLAIATSILLLKGGPVVGPHLSLLGQYLIGFDVSWTGLAVGLVEIAVVGFAVGYLTASIRNWGIAAYAALLGSWLGPGSRRG